MSLDYKVKKEAQKLQEQFVLSDYEALSLALKAKQIEAITLAVNPKL